MTFDERLERARWFFLLGAAERAAPPTTVNGNRNHGADYGLVLSSVGRADLAAYWLGASERDRLRTPE